MRNLILVILTISICSPLVYTQDLTVPNTILQELSDIVFIDDNEGKDTISFKVVFPDNYDSTMTYPVAICLSGGDQSEPIVNYCYAAWFRTKYFENFLMILPLNTTGMNLKDYSDKEVENIERLIKNNFNVSDENWIIAGTSNGGVACFNFIAKSPKLYQGVIVMPGAIDTKITVNSDWNHLKVILAYGENDSEKWIDAVKKTKKKIENNVSEVITVVLKGQGHILPIDFDLNQVYDKYFKN